MSALASFTTLGFNDSIATLAARLQRQCALADLHVQLGVAIRVVVKVRFVAHAADGFRVVLLAHRLEDYTSRGINWPAITAS
jgi:hypothetical protein